MPKLALFPTFFNGKFTGDVFVFEVHIICACASIKNKIHSVISAAIFNLIGKKLTEIPRLYLMLESIAVLVLVSLCSLGMGVYQFESSHAFRVLWQFISHDPNILTGEKYIVWDIRTSRVVMGILIGSMLAFSGTLLQGMFKNPLATGDLSEMELLATQVGNGTQILNNNFATLLSEIQKLGKVMALTRNEECLHERKGTYLNPDFSNPHAQLFVGEDIDLRIFLNSWKYGFSVVEGDKKSFQFFGIDGLALHKIYLVKDSNAAEFDGLSEKYRSENQNSFFDLQAATPKPAEKPDAKN